VGGGHRPQNRHNGAAASHRTSAISTDDLLHDDDTRSVGASSYVSASHSVVQLGRPPLPPLTAVLEGQAVARRAAFEISRESSKESSNSESDEQLERGRGMMSHKDHPPVLKSRISQSSLSSEASRQSGGGGGRESTPPPSHSPTSSRRSTRLMVKSYSQDTPNDLGKEDSRPMLFKPKVPFKYVY